MIKTNIYIKQIIRDPIFQSSIIFQNRKITFMFGLHALFGKSHQSQQCIKKIKLPCILIAV